MNISKYLIKIPYALAWRLSQAGNYPFPIVFYCSNFDDYTLFKDIEKYLPDLSIVSINRELQEELFEIDVSSILWPVYPQVVLMAANYSHKFPLTKIIKIGIQNDNQNFNEDSANKDINLFITNPELKKDGGVLISDKINSFLQNTG